MPKGQVIAALVVAALALGVALVGRTSGKVDDGDTRVKAALKAREVSVLVITKGRDATAREFLRGVRQAIAGQQRVRLIHVDTQSPVEQTTVARFHQAVLPLVVVVGLDGGFVYSKSSLVEPDAIKNGLAQAFTKPPIAIGDGGDHHH